LLYSLTTISGPPLAMMLNNQGYVKEEFRAALGLIRLVESVATAILYFFWGLYTAKSTLIMGAIAPSVVFGIPIGAALIGRLEAETFRRVCMSFDAWVVGYGMSKLLIQLHLVDDSTAHAVFAAVIIIDACLLYLFFSRRRQFPRAIQAQNSFGASDP
jgi:hypothetical protein